MPIVKPVYIDVTSSSSSTRAQPVVHLGSTDTVSVGVNMEGGKAKLKADLIASVAGKALLQAADAPAQRTALSLGNAATKSTGTTSGTVAAGDDTRIVNATPSSRALQTGQGLSGGGNLTTDRTLSIAAFTGLLAKDFDPPSQTYTKNQITTLKTYDVGGGGHIVLTGLRLPARGSAALKTRLLIKFSDNTSVFLVNQNDSALTDNMQGLSQFLMGDAGNDQAANNDGKRIQAIAFEVQNTDVSNDITVDLAAFRVRAYVVPAGGGSVTVTP